MTDPQTDDSTPPRKRIAVACGRCRKRKIRCSGDPGHGQPCSNCKNAGVDLCLFLRVQSQEAPLRDDRYEYNMDAARTMAQRGSAGHLNSSMAAQYSQDMHLMGSGTMPTPYHRSSSSSQAYPNMSSKYYSMADWTEAYGPDAAAVDYGLSCAPSYPVINSEPVHMVSAASYGHWAAPSSRQKSASSQQGHVYVDTESAGYPYSSTSSASLVHRPAAVPSGDSSAYSFSSVAASLPSTGGSERLLPNPVSRTLGSSTGVSPYRHDGLPAVAQAGGYASSAKSGHSSISTGTGHTSPTSPISDVAAVAAAAGYASSAYDYSGRSHGPASDVYGSVSSGETIFADSDRHAGTQGSAVDLTGYTYGGSTGSPDTASSAATGSGRRVSSAGSALTSRTIDSQGYAASDGSHDSHHSGAHHHSSSHHHQSHHHQSSSSFRHGHHHGHQSHSSSHHHGSNNNRHYPQQHQHQHHASSSSPTAVVNGGTASTGYAGEASGSNNSSTGASGGVVNGGTAAAESHRTLSVSSRR